MDIQLFVSQISSFASKACGTSKEGIIWCGHSIKAGYSRYAAPAVEKIFKVALAAFGLLQQLLQRGPATIFALSGILMLAGITAFKLADRKDYEDDIVAKTVCKTAGITAFIAATALTSLGLGALLTEY